MHIQDGQDRQDRQTGRGRVVAIAGSDSGGGAGIQADIKTITMLGGYGASVLTALTAQDTRHVHAIHPVPPDFIAQQMRVVLDDIGADAIKTGMMGDATVIDAVCDMIEAYSGNDAARMPVVVDPVMVSKGGDALLDPASVATLKRRLLLIADIVTPNVPEAEALTGLEIRDMETMRHAAEMLLTVGAQAVLVKGGHLDTGDELHDLLLHEGGERIYTSPRIDTRHTHGTGCTLASAIATGLAVGHSLEDAVERAVSYVQGAIRHAPGLGGGSGPLDHGWLLKAE